MDKIEATYEKLTMSVHIEFKKDLDSLSSELTTWSLGDARLLTRVEVNGECVPPIGEVKRDTGKYNDLYSIYIVTKNITKFLASSDQASSIHPTNGVWENELRFKKLDESRVKIDWEYSLSDYKHTEVIDRDALGSELVATGREYIQFARDVVFPHGEANPEWAGEYGKVYQLDQDREFIDELEAALDEVAGEFDLME